MGYIEPRGPLERARMLSKKEILRRYLVEIVAFKFGADFNELNVAIGQSSESTTTSILTPEDRTEIFRLACLVKTLHGKTMRNEINTIPGKHKLGLYWKISQPAMEVDYHLPALALDLVGSYTDHQCEPSKWGNIVVGHWFNTRWNTSTERTLNTHAYLISAIAPADEVQMILGGALEEFQREKILTNIKHTPCLYPEKEGYSELRTILNNHYSRYCRHSL